MLKPIKAKFRKILSKMSCNSEEKIIYSHGVRCVKSGDILKVAEKFGAKQYSVKLSSKIDTKNIHPCFIQKNVPPILARENPMKFVFSLYR